MASGGVPAAAPSDTTNVASRRERRKNARRAKRQHRLQSHTLHQAFKLNKKRASQPPAQDVTKTASNRTAKKHPKPKVERKRPRTKFEEYLEMETRKTAISAEEDLALERKLGKKLKLKEGVLRGSSDGLSELLEGMVSSSDFLETSIKNGRVSQGEAVMKVSPETQKTHLQSGAAGSEEDLENEASSSAEEEASELSGENEELDSSFNSSGGEGETRDEQSVAATTEVDWDRAIITENDQVKESSAKYVAPQLRVLGIGSNEATQLQRRIRGFLNRLSESNVESIAQEFSELFQAHGRWVVTENITNEILGALCSGPRGNEQYAAVFAAFVAGITASVGMDFGAKFMARLADSFEDQYQMRDNLAARNLTLLLSYLYTFKLVASDLVYDFLGLLCKRLEELDVATILTILQSCGLGLRAEDPTAMKEFVFNVQHRCEELKAAAGQSGATALGGKRMEYMLETICEIKNNKRRVKPESNPHVRLKKWLQKLRIEDVHLRALSWKKLLDPKKKGQWWISGGMDKGQEGSTIVVADIIDKDIAEAEKMLQLAASQRMNTDTRRAVFCVIMSGEDYLDAFEKILRLKLPGKQDREVLRVIVECCLQERVFNRYYSLLASKLCQHDKNHKFTLQYCLWDQFKQLNSMEIRRIANLAHLLAALIGTNSLSLSVLKVVDFSDSQRMTPKVTMHFRIFLRALLTNYTDETVWNAFSRIACTRELESFCNGLSFFLHHNLTKSMQEEDVQDVQERTLLLQRCLIAKKALTNCSGVRLK